MKEEIKSMAIFIGMLVATCMAIIAVAVNTASADQYPYSTQSPSYGYNADVDRPATTYDAARLFRGGRFIGVNDVLNKFRPKSATPVSERLPFTRAQVIACAQSDFCWLVWGTDSSFGRSTSVDDLRRNFRAEFIITGGKYQGVTDRPVVAKWYMISLLRLRGNPASLRPPSSATLQGRGYASAGAVAFLGILDPSFIRGKTIVTGDVVGRSGYVLVRDNGGRMDIVIENTVTNQYWYATEILPEGYPTRRPHRQ